jgi:hypothetical protein
MDSGITALVESKLNSKDIIQSIKSNMPLLLTVSNIYLSIGFRLTFAISFVRIKLANRRCY